MDFREVEDEKIVFSMPKLTIFDVLGNFQKSQKMAKK